MTETDIELAENITETADAACRTGGNVYLSVDRQQRLRLAAQRLESLSQVPEAEVTAALMEATKRFGALAYISRDDARAMLEAARKVRI